MDGGAAVMMVHSSELMPNGSPFRRTERSIRELHEQLAAFFDYARATGARPLTITEAARELISARQMPERAL
jgi:hypothetical protein